MRTVPDLLENQNQMSSSKGGIQECSKELKTYTQHNRIQGYAQNNPGMLSNACGYLVAIGSRKTTRGT